MGRDLFDGYSEKIKFINYVKNKNFKLNYNFSQKNAANLLAKGEILAVARGREEYWSFCSSGNRSILADPSNIKIVQKINELIKNRDFGCLLLYQF